jgi:hypothetical protein
VGQKGAVADLADVELEWVGGLRLGDLDLLDFLDFLDFLDSVERLSRNYLEPRLNGFGLGEGLWERPLLHHAGCIG